ncbi:hypothetical protein AB1K32_07520 [Metabacillus dongyingensis]|uniref:hypothetical protein n=1 Tax=Metabacillus dongyingensis TaxID=2874282 RepID=UPI003B8B8757
MKRMLVKETRETEILLSLSKLDYLNRSQLQILHNLGGERNAQKILKNMSDKISCFRDGESVYYLNSKGRSIVGGKARQKTLQARHYIMRNYIYIAFDKPETWKTEQRLKVSKKVTVVADAVFYDESNRIHIVESDHIQKMIKNEKKIEKYRKLIDLNVFETIPKFIWITTTEYRRDKLTALCKGLDTMIFTMAEFS